MRTQNSRDQATRAGFIEPMLSLGASELPERPEWEYEVKFDGYRAQGIRTAGRVQLRSRYNANFMTRFPTTEDMKKCRWLNPRIVA